MGLPAVAQRHHEQFGALEDALDLERKELVGARSQRLGGALPLLVDDGVNPRAQPATVIRMNRHGCINPTLGAE